MSFIPSNKITCDTIRVKVQGELNSDFYNVPFQSDFENFKRIIQNTYAELGLSLDEVNYSGGGLVSDPNSILDEQAIVRRIIEKNKYNPRATINVSKSAKR